MLKLAILISGHGSNLQAILDAITEKRLDATVSSVVSNKANAHGLIRATIQNIPTQIIERKKYATRDAFDDALNQYLQTVAPDLIVLAGFMHILGGSFVAQWAGRVLNIHPSLLPKYRGLDTHTKALAAGDTIHGSSVHFVSEALDAGPVIAQTVVDIDTDDTPETLQAKVQRQEHQLYPKVLQWFAEQRITLDKRTVHLDGKALPEQGVQINESSQ